MVWWLWAQHMAPFSGLCERHTPDDEAPDAAHLSALAAHGAQACCVWNAEDGFHHFSDNWARVTGLPPAECMAGTWLEFFHPDAQQSFAEAIEDLFSSDPFEQTDSITFDAKVMRGDSAWGWLNLQCVRMSGGGGREHVSVLVSDITELKQMADDARQAQRDSQLAQHGREAFLSNMSHELRTPLNAVLGFAQILESSPACSQEHTRGYMRHIRESGEELLSKINDLMEIANIEAHRTRMNEEPLNLREVIDAAVEIHSHTAFSNDIRLRFEPDRPSIVLHADRAKLIHAVSNVIAGAIEDSPRESDIIIGTHATAREGLAITVTNRGGARPKDHLDSIRQDLLNEQSDFSTDIGTIGIGLSIAKELIELHHGRMHVDHITGYGSIITLEMPAGRIVSLSARVKRKGRSQAAA